MLVGFGEVFGFGCVVSEAVDVETDAFRWREGPLNTCL